MKPCSPFPVPCSLFPLPSSLRRGSALLIVLGMVSFMVISSVAFSFYMRASRQPSSYLRTAVSGRYLLKSALANAIARIDGKLNGSGAFEGVYDDYYPGLVTAGTNVGDERTSGNWWEDRVFCPFGQADGEDVVATLTLEGLAYLPPAIINEVRWKARQTKTAEWQNLAYEVGRYAFCAVDVSDCFDVNKMRALGRTSGGRGRVGFSSLFNRGERWSDLDESLMSTFNTKVDTVAGGGNIPFVSMADFNLYFGKGSGFSPFCEYIGKSGDMQVLRESDETAQQALFITDTWFPPTNAVSSVRRFNLAGGGQNQPFDEYDEKFSVEDVLRMAGHTQLGERIRDRLGGVGTVALYDYLDADNVPTSYALPTVETAPMVCALGLKAGGNGIKPKIVVGTDVRKTTVKTAGLKQEIDVTATPYEFDWGVDALHVYGQAVFPFRRVAEKTSYAKNFKVDGLVRIFLAPADVGARLTVDSPVVPRTAEDWKDDFANGVVTRKVSIVSDNLSFASDPSEQKDAVKFFEGEVTVGVESRVIFWEVTKQAFSIDPATLSRVPVGAPETYYSMDGVTVATNPIETFDKSGKKENWLDELRSKAKPAMFENGAAIGEGDLPTKAADAGNDIHGGLYVPHVAVWVKLQNVGGEDSDKVVDYVPAYAPDDVTWGKHNPTDNDEVLTACGDAKPPILRFSGTTQFAYGVSAKEKLDAGDGALSWQTLYTVDPRFNYAPEAWYASTGTDPATLQDSASWLQTISGVLGQDGCDPDIFMFTSDQEYLQAMGELQFLPLTRDLTQAPGQIIEDYAKWNADYQFNGSVQSVMNFMPGMWQTYSAPDGDPIYNLGDPTIEIVSSSGDFRVNPFTPDRRIFMTAIANTPYDWYVASTNEELNLLGDCEYRSGKPKVSDALKHAFNPKTKCAEWADEEVDRICDAVRLGIRAGAASWSGSIASRPGWEHYFDRLAWFSGKGDDQKSFMGVNLQHPLYGVDRKYLHGFWRECFQNRQQLFLVFIRAEPLTVGGSGRAALANTQLGARGVALVWRDPEPPQYQRASRPLRTGVTVGADIAPHRTRVLFYHQFD